MSSGTRIPFDEAFDIAREAGERLKPTVARIKAVGSLRRRRESVGDLEFLAEPIMDKDLFDANPTPILDPVRKVMHELGDWEKGGDRMMKVSNLLGHVGLDLDLFLVHPPAEWGSLMAIRTGPADLGVQCMIRFRKKGLLHVAGHVTKAGKVIPTPTEEDFFELAGVDCVPPDQRDTLTIRLKQEGRR